MCILKKREWFIIVEDYKTQSCNNNELILLDFGLGTLKK